MALRSTWRGNAKSSGLKGSASVVLSVSTTWKWQLAWRIFRSCSRGSTRCIWAWLTMEMVIQGSFIDELTATALCVRASRHTGREPSWQSDCAVAPQKPERTLQIAPVWIKRIVSSAWVHTSVLRLAPNCETCSSHAARCGVPPGASVETRCAKPCLPDGGEAQQTALPTASSLAPGCADTILNLRGR